MTDERRQWIDSGWRTSKSNVHYDFKFVGGELARVNYRNGEYAGVWRGEWTAGFSHIDDAKSELYDLVRKR